MLLLEFLLSGRFRRVSGKIGIDVTLRFHQVVASTILLFIFLHPFLYAFPRLSSDPVGALSSLQRMFSSGGLRSGVVAWALLLPLVAIAVWRDRIPLSYEAWRASHGLGAVVIAIFGMHHTLSVGTYSADPVLATFWLVLGAVAIASLTYVYLVKPLRRRAKPYKVVANKLVADETWQVTVEPTSGHRLDFVAGQFAWANFGHSAFSLKEHPFSMSSAPAMSPWIEFTIRESGDFTDNIGRVAIGTTTYLDAPHGAFTHAGLTPGPMVLIAGGVGLAPIIGILRQMRHEAWQHPVTLIYGNRVASQILYRKELEAIAAEINLSIHLVLSEPPKDWRGHIGELTLNVLSGCLAPLDTEASYLVCGPPRMLDSVETALLMVCPLKSSLIALVKLVDRALRTRRVHGSLRGRSRWIAACWRQMVGSTEVVLVVAEGTAFSGTA